MKLRNKKTGEIIDLEEGRITDSGYGSAILLSPIAAIPEAYTYTSLAELCEEWEDYKPAEPIIKDEKIRKAVRAWAEANNVEVVFICALSGGWGVRHDWEDDGEYYSIDLLFKGCAPLGVGNQYTIAELCGEEDE